MLTYSNNSLGFVHVLSFPSHILLLSQSRISVGTVNNDYSFELPLALCIHTKDSAFSNPLKVLLYGLWSYSAQLNTFNLFLRCFWRNLLSVELLCKFLETPPHIWQALGMWHKKGFFSSSFGCMYWLELAAAAEQSDAINYSLCDAFAQKRSWHLGVHQLLLNIAKSSQSVWFVCLLKFDVNLWLVPIAVCTVSSLLFRVSTGVRFILRHYVTVHQFDLERHYVESCSNFFVYHVLWLNCMLKKREKYFYIILLFLFNMGMGRKSLFSLPSYCHQSWIPDVFIVVSVSSGYDK